MAWPTPVPIAPAETLTIAEAARLLRISQRKCNEALIRGDLPSLKIGGRRLVPRAQLDRVLNGNRDDTPTLDAEIVALRADLAALRADLEPLRRLAAALAALGNDR